MKSAKVELATTIAAAIAGVVIAYFITGLFIGEIESVSVKTVETEVTADLAEPDQNIFNYKSLNPTVEIYIGSGDVQTVSEVPVEVTDTQIDDTANNTTNDTTNDTTNNTTDTTDNTNNSTKQENS